MHSAAWHRNQISWRLLARADAESGGRGVFPWAYPDVADQFAAPGKATSLSSGKTGAGPGSDLSGRSDVVRRWQEMRPILREPLKPMITGAPLLELSLSVDRAGYLWSPTARQRMEKIPLPESFGNGDSSGWDFLRSRLGAKLLPSAGGTCGACRLLAPLALRFCLSLQPLLDIAMCHRP
jgi:hypothetical protein